MNKPPNKPKPDENAREAERILRRVERDSESLGSSSMARNANRLRDHFSGNDNPEDDRIEIVGKRIGRLLALVAFFWLAWSLYVTYFS